MDGNNTMYTYAVKNKILTTVNNKAVLQDDGIYVRQFMLQEIERLANE